jgi:hypothetical protein
MRLCPHVPVMIFRKFLFVCMLLAFEAGGLAAERPKPSSILPDEFGGWTVSGAAKTSNDPAVADASNADLLKEYGFTDFASAIYKAADGRKLTIKAARFADATGAYGAFTYYKIPAMLSEEIGDQGASLNERVLFFRGNILVDAVFQKLSAMSAAELRELSNDLPLPAGGSRNVPALTGYLPAQGQEKNSVKYVVGPVGLSRINAPIPASLVDFNAGAEVAEASYTASGQDATLMVISYPTPQIAAANLQRLDAARQQSEQQQAAKPTLMTVGPYFDRRTGPLVVVAAGPLSQSEAKSLLESVNYDADVTWNQNTYFDKKNNIANLLVNVILLCGIIAGFAILAGVAFGGIRVLIRRMSPNNILDRREEVEFISLHLSDKNK